MPSTSPPPNPLPTQATQVFRGDDFRVVSGANHGDPLGLPDDLCAGDIYELDEDAQALRLILESGAAGREPRIGAGSAIGAPGEAVQLRAALLLLTPHGDRVEVLLLDHGGMQFALPLSPMARKIGYTLIGIDEAPEAVRLSDLICVSFLRGTLITLPSGRQQPIEALAPGDRVLTRDHGAQPIAWIGRAALKAVGAFAPVVIGAGELGNARDLIVSQHHRVFLYQHARSPGLPTAEVLVQAKHLVDGDHIFLREGGVAEYFSLVFDRHEIIYAEGIPCESLLVSEATVARLPPDLAEEVRARFPGLSQTQHFGTEAGRQALEGLPPDLLSRRPPR